MAKKTISKIAAIALAGLTAFSTVGVAASADVQINTAQEIWGTVVKVTSVTGVKTTYTYNATDKKWETATAPDTTCDAFAGRIFSTATNVATAWKDIAKPENGTKPTGTLVGGETYSTYSFNYTTSAVDLSALYATGTVVTYDAKTGEINGATGTSWTVKVGSSTGGTGGANTGTGVTGNYYIPTTNRTASTTSYYCAFTDTWYPNLASLKDATGSTTFDLSQTTTYDATRCYFDPVSGFYVSYAQLSTYPYAVLVNVGNTTTTNKLTIYRVKGVYYTSYDAAYSAAGSNASIIETITSYNAAPANYFSQVTGNFYSTYAAALAASNGYSSKVVVFNGASTNYYDYYYYNYLYGYGDFSDPYYYYWLSKGNSSSSKDTTTATLGKKKGWTSIASYLKKVSAGSTATIDMNNETVVPADVFAAIQGRNVNIKLVLKNGVTYTVNGKDVTTAKAVDLDTKYNTKYVPSKLVKAAYKKNDAVSSAQISVDAGTLGFTSDLTVKFSTKRAGYKAKIYRYNSSRNSLQLVDTATIASSGKCTFDKVTKGGDFVIVIYK